MNNNIFSQIRQEINNFIYNSIEVVPGWSFNQFETIKKINLYRASQFLDKTPISGLKKIFMNVVNFRAMVATKFLDVDMKDFRLIEKDYNSQFKVKIFENELKQWFKQKNFSKILNELAEELPVFGSVVVKKVKNNIQIVDLRKLFLDPSVEKIQDSNFITQIHYLTEIELRKKADVWDNIDILLVRKEFKQEKEAYENQGEIRQGEDIYYKIYERYGEVPKSWITGKDKDSDTFVRSLFIVADAFNVDKKGNENGVILFKSEWNKEYPFKDCHYSKIKGRWLGYGVVEELFPVQERINEIANLKRVSMSLSSMHIFQRSGTGFVRNLLTDLENGDVINTGQSPIQPIANEERSLSAFQSEEQRWDTIADRQTFSYDVVRGEALPATTPATNAVIQSQSATSVFSFKRENFVIFLREVVKDYILPEAKKELMKEGLVRITGDDVEYLDEKIIEMAIETYKMNYLEATGFIPEKENIGQQKEKLRNELKKIGYVRFIEKNTDFYKDIDFDFDIVADNENFEPQVLVNNLQSIIPILQQMQDPVIRKIGLKIVSLLGIDPIQIEKELDKTKSIQQLTNLPENPLNIKENQIAQIPQKLASLANQSQ
jgi:hypothetical protein